MECTKGNSNFPIKCLCNKLKKTDGYFIVTPERRNMVAIGTEDGVWMGFGGETKTFRPVLTGIGNVMQMAVIEVFGIFVVLVGRYKNYKVDFKLFSLDEKLRLAFI